MTEVIIITGTSRGIGLKLASYFLDQGKIVVGCSRGVASIEHVNYIHFSLNISNEAEVIQMFGDVKQMKLKVSTLINNAGVASMNHSILTPGHTVKSVFETNLLGTFLFSREAAKRMKLSGGGNIINFSTVAVPLLIEGEAIYGASKSAVLHLTKVLSKELSGWGIRVNAIGPNPILTDLIKGVPKAKIEQIIAQQAVKRYGDVDDLINVIEFFINPKSSMITGQVIYLGGVSN